MGLEASGSVWEGLEVGLHRVLMGLNKEFYFAGRVPLYRFQWVPVHRPKLYVCIPYSVHSLFSEFFNSSEGRGNVGVV